MDPFQLYLKLGFEHISDINGYDHILFIVALCAVYRLRQWRHLLILVTAFTVGHSLTLALAALKILVLPSDVIEFLIPVTILLTSIYNVYLGEPRPSGSGPRANYFLALFFGLIHGMGFSNYFRALLGKEESIVAPLLAFNIGLELGQLVIVAITLGAASLITLVFRAKQRDWTIFISGATAGIAFILMLETRFW